MKGIDKMNISKRGIGFLMQVEGFKKNYYKDSAGYLTIGVGHLLRKSELNSGKIYINGLAVKWSKGLTKEQVVSLLNQDIDKYNNYVNQHVDIDLTQYQHDAIVSFCFNVGRSAFKNSTLLKHINKSNLSDIPNQLRRWVYAGGKKSKGLSNRREKEIMLWEGILD